MCRHGNTGGPAEIHSSGGRILIRHFCKKDIRYKKLNFYLDGKINEAIVNIILYTILEENLLKVVKDLREMNKYLCVGMVQTYTAKTKYVQ